MKCFFEIFLNKKRYVIFLYFSWRLEFGLLFSSLIELLKLIIKFIFDPVHIIDKKGDFKGSLRQFLIFWKYQIIVIFFLFNVLNTLLSKSQETHLFLRDLDSLLNLSILIESKDIVLLFILILKRYKCIIVVISELHYKRYIFVKLLKTDFLCPQVQLVVFEHIDDWRFFLIQYWR